MFRKRITCGYSKGIWNFRAIGQFFFTLRGGDPSGIIHDIECYIMIHPNEVKRASNLIRFLSGKYRQPISHHLFDRQWVITKYNRVQIPVTQWQMIGQAMVKLCFLNVIRSKVIWWITKQKAMIDKHTNLRDYKEAKILIDAFLRWANFLDVFIFPQAHREKSV